MPPALAFNRSQPWDSVWVAAVGETSFWHSQFEEPAILILTDGGRLTDMVTGEAPIEYARHGPVGGQRLEEQQVG